MLVTVRKGVHAMSGLSYSTELREQACALRRSMTPQEKHLWYDFLRSCPVRFRRQRPIGDYVVDFYCPAARLVVELDGHSHVTDSGRGHDARRKAYLESLGLKVIRFFDYEVDRDFERVCRHISVVTEERCSALS